MPRSSRTQSRTTSSVSAAQPRTSSRTAGVSTSPRAAASSATGALEEPVGQRLARLLVDLAQTLVATGRPAHQRDVAR